MKPSPFVVEAGVECQLLEIGTRIRGSRQAVAVGIRGERSRVTPGRHRAPPDPGRALGECFGSALERHLGDTRAERDRPDVGSRIALHHALDVCVLHPAELVDHFAQLVDLADDVGGLTPIRSIGVSNASLPTASSR